jgi:hypothetical protein
LPVKTYPQRYCSGLSIKGMEDREKMGYVDKATCISPRTRANNLMSPYAYSALVKPGSGNFMSDMKKETAIDREATPTTYKHLVDC